MKIVKNECRGTVVIISVEVCAFRSRYKCFL